MNDRAWERREALADEFRDRLMMMAGGFGAVILLLGFTTDLAHPGVALLLLIPVVPFFAAALLTAALPRLGLVLIGAIGVVSTVASVAALASGMKIDGLLLLVYSVAATIMGLRMLSSPAMGTHAVLPAGRPARRPGSRVGSRHVLRRHRRREATRARLSTNFRNARWRG